MNSLLIFSALMLFGTETMSAAVNNQFNKLASQELSHLHIQGLYVIFGIISAGLVYYCLTNRNRIVNAEKSLNQKEDVPQNYRA